MKLKEFIITKIEENIVTFNKNCYFINEHEYEYEDKNKSKIKTKILLFYKFGKGDSRVSAITDKFISIKKDNYPNDNDNYIYFSWSDLETVYMSHNRVYFKKKNIVEPFNFEINKLCLNEKDSTVIVKIINETIKFYNNTTTDSYNSFINTLEKVKEKKEVESILFEEDKIYPETFISKQNVENNDSKELESLTSLEHELIKAILGIFKFIFFIIPKNIFNFIRNILPEFIKLLRVSILFLVWLIIVFHPLAFFFYKVNKDYFSYNNLYIFTVENLNFDIFQEVLKNNIFILWTLWIPLALVGSFWGLKNIRVSIFDKIKKFMRKKSK
jgi:hypothetical protein